MSRFFQKFRIPTEVQRFLISKGLDLDKSKFYSELEY